MSAATAWIVEEYFRSHPTKQQQQEPVAQPIKGDTAQTGLEEMEEMMRMVKMMRMAKEAGLL